MAYYIKARPNVAEVLGLKGLCSRTADGNVLLWQADMQKTGCVVLSDAVACVGGVLLTPEQARAERSGEQSLELPQPTDPRFVTDTQYPADADGAPKDNNQTANTLEDEPTPLDEPADTQGEPVEEAEE